MQLEKSGPNLTIANLRSEMPPATTEQLRALLQAAIRVNRTWYMAGVPILWRRPSADALGAQAIPLAARRSFYAAHIRYLILSRRGALWRAIANNGGAVEASAPAAADGGAAVSGDASETGNMALPPHLSLCVCDRWSDRLTWVLRNDMTEAMRQNQAVFVGHISQRLEELRHFISALLLARLSALPVQGEAR